VLLVIDTNILLISISDKSKYHWLYKLIRNKKIHIAFTHDILAEYEEQIALHWHYDVANDIVRTLNELSTSHRVKVYYHLNLITTDPDDNKFVDCAFAANADYIITNDHHFNVLKNIDFPTIPVLRLEEFEYFLKANNMI